MKNKYIIAVIMLFALAVTVERVSATESSTSENDTYTYVSVSEDDQAIDAANAPCSSLIVAGSVTAVSCPGGNDGSITLTVTGGNPPYTYLWNDGSTLGSRTGLTRGVYTLTVTDDSSCVKVINRWVNSPSQILINDVLTPASCNGAMDGSIVTAVSGGTAPYTYLWNTGSTAASLTGIGRGVYSVTITDNNGCTRIYRRWVNDPPAFGLTGSGTAATCWDAMDGTLSITVVGVVSPPFTYLWSDGSTDQNRTGLGRGAYSATVTGSGSCTASINLWVSSPPRLLVNSVVNQTTCYGSSDGTIIASANGGTPPYSYAWSNGVTTAINNGLARGIYDLTVTDASGCTTSIRKWVNSPAPIFIGQQITNPSSSGASDGSVKAFVFGGTPPYQYIWSNAQTTQTATGLMTGSVTCIVIDANFCSAQKSFTLTFPEANSRFENYEDVDVNVYPNPSLDNFNIQMSGTNAEKVDIQLINMNGRIVETTFNKSSTGTYQFGDDLPPGVYILRFTAADINKTVRIVKTM